MAKTKVLSVRVPDDVMFAVDDLCKRSGKNRSQWLSDVVANSHVEFTMNTGGSIQTRTIPKEIESLLIAAGVTVIGIGAYSMIGNYLEQDVDAVGKRRFSEAEVEVISISLAVMIAMLGMGAINSLVK
jgi:hypothetical protein